MIGLPVGAEHAFAVLVGHDEQDVASGHSLFSTAVRFMRADRGRSQVRGRRRAGVHGNAFRNGNAQLHRCADLAQITPVSLDPQRDPTDVNEIVHDVAEERRFGIVPTNSLTGSDPALA